MNTFLAPCIALIWVLAISSTIFAADSSGEKEPKLVRPGPPPSDALVLFDGRDLAKWQNEKGAEAKWKLSGDGSMEVNGTGSIMTREEFGDCQLHVEWATPTEVKGEGQGCGNSGVYLQGRYEIQVLDSYQVAVKGDVTTAAKFKGVTPQGPLLLQDHGNPVRYRNIWIRRLN